jgi:hypothetical protein
MPPRQAPSFFDDASRPARVRLQMTLTILSLLLWAWSLYLPAVHVRDSNKDLHAMPVAGLACAVMSMAHYPANVWLLAGPLLCWRARRAQRPSLQSTLGAIAVLFMLHVAATPFLPLWPYHKEAWPNHMTFDRGFLVWLTAHMLATIALLTPVWGVDHDRRAANAAYRALRKKWLTPTPAN